MKIPVLVSGDMTSPSIKCPPYNENCEMAFFETLQDIFRNNPLPINLMKRGKENLKNKENSAGWMHFYSHLIQTPCVLYFSPV